MSVGGEDTCTYLLYKNMEQWNGVLNSCKLLWDVQPGAKWFPLLPGYGLLPEGGRRQPRRNRFVWRILSMRCFAAHGRRNSRKGYCCGKTELKRWVKSVTVRWVSRDAASASWLSTLEMRTTDMCVRVCQQIHAASLRSGPTIMSEMTMPRSDQISCQSTTVLYTLVAVRSSGTMSGTKMWRCTT